MRAGILTEMIESTSTSVLIFTGNTKKSIKTEKSNQDPEKCLAITKKETHTMIKSLNRSGQIEPIGIIYKQNNDQTGTW
jgi:hypothetical protein